jgi:hypothetical protein
VAFEDSQIAGKEKDASVLQLQWDVNVMRADLEKKKNLSRVSCSPRALRLLIDFVGIRS